MTFYQLQKLYSNEWKDHINSKYEGKSLYNRDFTITFCKSTNRNCLCLIFGHSPPASQHTWSTCPQACRCPLEKSFFGVAFNQLYTASITSSSANFRPRKCSFIGPNKWKSNGAKSRVYGGCFNTSDFRARSVSTVCAAVWGRALLWSNNTLFEWRPRRFDRIAGFNSFTSMSLYRALVTVWPFSWKCTDIGPLTSQKMVSMTFQGEACVLNFLVAGDDGCFQCIDCLLLSGS
jgi:hypothetical protein